MCHLVPKSHTRWDKLPMVEVAAGRISLGAATNMVTNTPMKVFHQFLVLCPFSKNDHFPRIISGPCKAFRSWWAQRLPLIGQCHTNVNLNGLRVTTWLRPIKIRRNGFTLELWHPVSGFVYTAHHPSLLIPPSADVFVSALPEPWLSQLHRTASQVLSVYPCVSPSPSSI